MTIDNIHRLNYVFGNDDFLLFGRNAYLIVFIDRGLQMFYHQVTSHYYLMSINFFLAENLQHWRQQKT